MQKILGLMRKAVTDYQMIESGDRVAVGVSGGKDSMVLLLGLVRLQRFLKIPFTMVAISLDPMFDGKPTDYTTIQAFCDEHGIDFVQKQTDIGEVVFNIRKETNPCSLCSRMRRGILHDTANEQKCNKIALGHHYDDAVETFMMNLFHEGRVGCFSPVTYLSRKNITMIRPLVYVEESTIQGFVERMKIPIVKSVCPIDGTTSRQTTKVWFRDMEKNYPGIKKRIFGAIKRGNVSDWGGVDYEK